MKKTVTVANKSAGRVVYIVPELNVRREFMPHEVRKNVDVNELEQLAQRPGGKEILSNYLQVQDVEVITNILNFEPALEYWINDNDMARWLKECSLEELQDALEFAPDGTKDLIKDYAIQINLNDFAKRQAIKDILGFDVTNAIELSNDSAANAASQPQAPQRRAQTTSIKVPTVEPEAGEEKKKIISQ